MQISQKLDVLQKHNDIFKINVKITFRGNYCNYHLNFAVDECNLICGYFR